ncbi:pyruvate kinase [Roseateles asaccharophilus]|uniref:Pyruvate kinase n=1 Tax=Roseateles asaccharophilus TaxID=582607 RepID=A0ABU2AC82_9BURK|nr:pyruvate kinase [Roseateles asaccharophilus]MDR7334808.1 pyruvate kinase [Roseateles asaccharophilus]
MRRTRNAKIVATLGPASSDPETVRRLFLAGVDVFRLNFSHGSADDHRARFAILRELEQRTGRPIGILADLQGPKLRVGTFQDGPVMLVEGQAFRLDLDPAPGDARRAGLPHPEIFAALVPGAELLLDDGRLRLVVEECGPDFAQTRVAVGGWLSERKGVNVPSVVLPITALTAKDRRDLALALELGADWIALSFVQRPEDVAEARALIEGRAAIVAKLEKPQAIERLDEIVALSDAIMVARGDLGVELPAERVPALQKRIVRSCRHLGKPVIVATQMLESMVSAPVPTRAEASDVATAIYDGADAVMLSAESASGKHPVEAVDMMNRIIQQVETDPLYRQLIDASHSAARVGSDAAEGICCAMRRAVAVIRAAAIVCCTSSGHTSLRAARERPESPILSLTPHVATARRLALAWGMHSVHAADVEDVAQMSEAACDAARREGFAQPGQMIVAIAGMPFGTPGTTNLLRIATV